MRDYYARGLAGGRLRLCYELAPPRVRRYLEAEIEFVLGHVSPGNRILELGCGYGRVLSRLVERAGTAVGIDTSLESLRMARETLSDGSGVHLARMSAGRLGLRDRLFDLVVCVQNGISVFGLDRRELVLEAARVTRVGGTLLISSYSTRFWEDRLRWFEIQAEHGLIGEIDHDATGDGVIVCKDGFRATGLGVDEFARLTAGFGASPSFTEVDRSSLFCELKIE
jgi:2-polyprenyl-6-hydroxyphenyl methylase/3-demethylubiquinone-9 3-methyltransferase